jgi:hypothetical protein
MGEAPWALWDADRLLGANALAVSG